MTQHSEIHSAGTGPGPGFWLLTLLLIAGAGYIAGVQRLAGRRDRWPGNRSFAAAGGLLCLAVAVLPAPGPAMTFPAHVVQHLLLAMVGPMLLARSAPITLALRALPRAGRRYLVNVLHGRVAAMLTLAPVVLILDVGGMYAYYLTPLYETAQDLPWLAGLIKLHMFLAGCLLSWYLVGVDPVAHRPSTRSAVIVLLIAAAGHDILAKLLYAHGRPAAGGTPEQIHLGAQIMYYGGNLVEVVLAIILMNTWYTRGGRALRQRQRREQRPLGGSIRGSVGKS